MAGKVESKKLKEYEDENYFLLRRSDKHHFPYNWLSLSEEDDSVSLSDNFVIVNVFNSVLSLCTLLLLGFALFLETMLVGFNFNLTFRLKPKLVASKLLLFGKPVAFQTRSVIGERNNR